MIIWSKVEKSILLFFLFLCKDKVSSLKLQNYIFYLGIQKKKTINVNMILNIFF